MKIKLTPELAYLIGLWRKRRSFEGLGVHGDQKILETFSKEALEQKLTTPDKLLTNGKKVYFYHTAYKKFFNQVEEEQLERFKYLNEYAANYLAGLFDAVGEIDENGVVSLSKLTNEDELMLLRLGFKTKRKKEKCIIEKPLVFLSFIKNYVKISKENKIFEIVEKIKK
ncbi:MAG: hypothetical protein QXF35_00780 [Candidatus Bilamarchaeaceae archaeon]